MRALYNSVCRSSVRTLGSAIRRGGGRGVIPYPISSLRFFAQHGRSLNRHLLSSLHQSGGGVPEQYYHDRLIKGSRLVHSTLLSAIPRSRRATLAALYRDTALVGDTALMGDPYRTANATLTNSKYFYPKTWVSFGTRERKMSNTRFDYSTRHYCFY